MRWWRISRNIKIQHIRCFRLTNLPYPVPPLDYFGSHILFHDISTFKLTHIFVQCQMGGWLVSKITKNLASSVAMRLPVTKNYQGRNRVVVMDNYFTSVPLFLDL